MFAHPAYQEISHFRAPYKNAYLSGYGADELAPPQQVPEILKKEDNVYYWRGQYKDAALKTLENMRYIFIGGPTNRVQVVGYTPEEIAAMQSDESARAALMAFNARKWLEDQVSAGQTVFAPVWLVIPQVPTIELASLPSGNKAAVAEAASTPLVGILAEPGGLSIAGFRISWPMLAVGAVVLGGGAYFLTRKRR